MFVSSQGDNDDKIKDLIITEKANLNGVVILLHCSYLSLKDTTSTQIIYFFLKFKIGTFVLNVYYSDTPCSVTTFYLKYDFII